MKVGRAKLVQALAVLKELQVPPRDVAVGNAGLGADCAQEVLFIVEEGAWKGVQVIRSLVTPIELELWPSEGPKR